MLFALNCLCILVYIVVFAPEPKVVGSTPASRTISRLTTGPGRAKTNLPMKLKNWVLWLCVAALLATEVFLFQAKSQRDAALVQARESQQKVAQLQADLDQLKQRQR